MFSKPQRCCKFKMDFGIPQWCKAGVQTIFIFITTTLLSGARLEYRQYLFSSQQISRSKQHTVSRLLTLPTEVCTEVTSKCYLLVGIPNSTGKFHQFVLCNVMRMLFKILINTLHISWFTFSFQRRCDPIPPAKEGDFIG